MKVILQENVEGLGYLGDVLTATKGDARNYLLPRKKAVVDEER
ncbi:MAG: 50S ribosomal protein L9, partial [Nitrospira sp.]|nr:50S ribosomal protein L9 [Nitrospira sp.]